MGSGSITSTGTVLFTDDLRDVKSVSDGGSLTVQTRRLLSSRRLEISASSGSVKRRYYVNNSEQPWTEESGRWFADQLPFLVRRSGVSADERVRQIAEVKGVKAVLDEIKLLYTDSVRGRYFRALFETTRLGRRGRQRGVQARGGPDQLQRRTGADTRCRIDGWSTRHR